ncbi:YlbF family regulator [Priestia koreensis]|uniref:YlbF family regulator n=1 Tax=Priestia koreensis TaxID=284581 RepID=UPI001F581AD1|nr:YlbF family regulator [Priestia koreensis]MCM3004738.1 YlbF family regulator [Priestia koreensis]UNL85542.1 YlbF family regulator [Priestia koreensis]
MAVNVYDVAYDLEKAVRASEEYSNLKQAYQEVEADSSAKELFDKFRNIQLELQQKQMSGQEISQQEVEQAQQTVAFVQQNPKIAKLMESEQRMSTLIAEVNKIVMKPLEDIYGTVQQ